MSVVEASSGTYRSRVDGTLVLQVEIEPRHARAALELFGMPGTPMALAALKINGADSESKSAQAGSTVASGQYESAPPLKEGPRRKLGPICEWLVMRCKEDAFQDWVARQGPDGEISESTASAWCRRVCCVTSRKEIDGNADAEARFESLIRKPWAKHQRTVGAEPASTGEA